MGTSLPNQTPRDTDSGLIKTTDDSAISDGTLKKLSDGDGNDLGVSVSTDKLKADGKLFIETVDAGDATNQAALFWDSGTSPDGEIKYRNVSDFATDGGAYDTGWLDFDTYDGSTVTWGLLSITNEPDRPQFRIIGRTVHFKGTLLIPLENGGSLVSDYNNYLNTNSVDVADTASGITILSSQNLRFPTLFNVAGDESILVPDSNKVFQLRKGARTITSNNDPNETIVARNVVDVRFNTSGTMDIQCIFDDEDRDTSATFQPDNILRQLTTVANSGDYTLYYDTVRTSWDGNTSTPTIYQNNFNTSAVTLEYPINMDMTRGDNFGGLRINMDGMFYHISSATSVDSIHALF